MASPRILTKFYHQDVVRRVNPLATTDSSAQDNINGIVMRCWQDAEEPVPPTVTDPLMRPLTRGEVGVSFYRQDAETNTRREFERQILPESELLLVDRTFHPGDVCKRSIDHMQSGVIVHASVNGRCEHVVSGERLEGWTTLDELSDRTYAEVGDFVAYDNWIGQVIELFDEVLVEISSGQIIRMPELGSRFSVGEKGPDILPQPTSTVHSLFGFLLGNNRPSPGDTCVDVVHSVYAINWLALSQALDPEDAATRRRPQQFWTGTDMSKLTLIRSLSDLEMRVGDRVTFKDESKVPGTTHGTEPGPRVVIKVFTVTETQTFCHVLWQDGTKETIRSTDLIPYVNPDEYDCWPGDWVIWNGEDEKRAVIIQSVNSAHRIASVLIPDTGKIELVPLLELDPHGISDTVAALETRSEGLGVRRGDFVFVHPEGQTNGSRVIARVPRIGEVEPWVRDAPFIDGQLAGFRKEMSEMGADIARRRGAENLVEARILRPSADSEMLWLGEVTDINLDGTAELTHPNGTVKSYPLQRLTKLYDGLDQLEDDVWEEESEHPGLHEEHPMWTIQESGAWDSPSDSGDDWPSDTDEQRSQSSAAEAPLVNGNGNGSVWPDVALAPLEVVSGLLSSTLLSSIHGGHDGPDTPKPAPTTDLIIPTTSETERPVSPDVPKVVADDVPTAESPDNAGDGDSESSLKRFEIQPSAPVDHAYYDTIPAQPKNSFLARLAKEYRALSSSLPDSILIRAYEDRTDLLRSLIIGPENTPYEDCPFVIDWMLDSNFPHTPPQAHFLSWTNGNGRVNPNLYEEGKVCLSILGTWQGDQNEVWNPARSSLLQAFVSIQGLVLVKEPWFCEPAYEKLRGTPDGIVNSRLYNEKAFVLSRGFVRRALELPPGGLESEIDWLYRRNGRLDKLITNSQRLIEKSKSASDSSEDSQDDPELAVPLFTMAVPESVSIRDLSGKFVMNKSLSGETDRLLMLQGIGWIKRKIIATATVTLAIKHYKDDAGVEKIDIDQTLTGGIPATREERTLTWTDRKTKDNLFGPVIGKSRRCQVAELEEEFLKKDWTPDTVEAGVVHSYVESDTAESGATWNATQTWGIQVINGERRHARNVRFVASDGEVIETLLVYDYLGSL
ncbi:isocitrate lyase [Favolaschia claudopus]|uniref:Isocitrate lyase n=1 Tax=Favolaschia claudopus TaxID=2862362 RepID=A0AAW0EIA1_9AGAR